MEKTMISTKKCLICKGGTKNDSLHWHIDPDTGNIWVYCVGVCQRGYSLYDYCARSGLSVKKFLKNKFDFKESHQNEVTKMEWPRWYLPLSDPRAKAGVDYIAKRGLKPADNMYYDSVREGIVFPYFFGEVFCGAQIRFIKEWIDDNGTKRKVDTLPGTRLGLLFYNFNQESVLPHIKGFIVVEGGFDVQAIQQALDAAYGSVTQNPWRCVACSGAGSTKHQRETIREWKEKGYKVILAPDADDAGLKMLNKLNKEKAITHYAFPEDEWKDWNDKWQDINDPQEFMKWFFGRVKSV